jgi:hypothetical protein
MIKLEIPNIDKIADCYYWQIKQINRRKTDIIREYYIDHLEDFVLCDFSQMGNIRDDFNQKFAYEIAQTEQCYQNYITYKGNVVDKNDPKYKNNCKKLKDSWEGSLYFKFCTYMENQYNTCFQNEVIFNKADKSTRNNHDKLGVWIAKLLDIKTCPYCNRIYTFTISSKDRSIRPEFDHFYPKSKFPYLALSFYNIVPSCPICNHVKGTKLVDYHPYKKGFGEDYKFIIDENQLRNRNVKEIKFTNSSNKNIDCFMLKDLYNEHLDYINEIIYKQVAYSDDNLQNIIDSFQSMGIKGDISSYIWGCYLDNALHIKRPLSKLTKDILDQLKSLG